MAKHGTRTSKCQMSGDLCTAPLNQRLGAAALLKLRSVLSHRQHRAQSSSHRCGLQVLGMEGMASACGAVPADLCWELSTYGCGDTTVAGASCLHGHAALTTEHMVFTGHFRQGKFQNFSLAFPSRDEGG